MLSMVLEDVQGPRFGEAKMLTLKFLWLTLWF